MYLKRLESVGFKSFAERINVEFVPGVTAVVGPNGSGKSNITDAIRWVLGEQSIKSLRGSKMEDIIFQGSDTRKALNVAEVTLVLDNSKQTLPLEYEEVSVTRRVYRSGASEFYINKQSCRLKDIIDLFMDSGLGREAFSIISQGKVEEVLSSKAEERRVIFEEAAGVLKYKRRKNKAEFKLLETEENLNRIEDIVYEIEQQINPLQEQATIAKEYIQINGQLKQQEISLLVTEIEQLHNEWQTLLKALEEDNLSEIELKTKIQHKEAGVEAERQTIQKLDDLIESLQADLVAITKDVEQSEGEKRLLHERQKHYTVNKEKLEREREITKHRIEQLTAEFNGEKHQLLELGNDSQTTKESISKLEDKLMLEVDDIADKIEEQKAEYIEYLNKQAVKRNERQSIEQRLQRMDSTKDNQAEKILEMMANKESLTTIEKTLLFELEQKKQEYHNENEAVKKLKYKLIEERKQLDATQKNLSKGQQMIAKLKSRKEMLEEMKEDFQGFFHGVKKILKAREQNVLQNIHGAIIELIDVPEDYVTAIETVLGGQAQHIVVDHDHSARDAINWLKRTNNGRATFLPITSIKPRYLNQEQLTKVKSHVGFIGVAADLIQTKEKYTNIVQYLMGHVILAHTLKDANEIAAILMRRNRVVTLDGDVVNPGGSMSGGAKKNTNQSLFTREKELQELIVTLNDYEQKATLLETRVGKHKEYIINTEAVIEQTEQNMLNIQGETQKVSHKYRQNEIELASLSDQLLMYDQNNQQHKHDQEKLTIEKEQIDESLILINHQLDEIQEGIDRLTEQEVNFTSEKKDMQNKLHQLQVQFAEQEERLRNQKEKTLVIETELDNTLKQYDVHTTDLSKLREFQQTEQTPLNIDHQIQEKTIKKQSVLEKIQQNRSERLEKTQFVGDETREIKEVIKQHQAFMKNLQQKEVTANRLDVDLENKLSLLQTEYTITYEKARQSYGKTDNIEETKIQVKSLKQAIQALGTVNLGSIDEYERISERYTFLMEQKTDLVEAKQTLFDIIAEMDDVMKKSFSETFTQIRDEFTVVFKSLFGGGRAELNLTDPNNMLDTGIDIIAQPPGKKLQHLGLLSGGERALTAIALLFAILRVRPVPFCVLDEVEAALDEANVVRFAKYVKLHSEDTQFIVITHRKGTMEEANVLYGVTMEESGVSRLVSVQLEATDALVNT